MHSLTDWAATEEREREAGGRREMETARDRRITKKRRQRQIEEEEIRFAEGQRRHIQ